MARSSSRFGTHSRRSAPRPKLKLKPWDMAAGAVILEEAGGRLTDFTGKVFSIYGKEIVASNGPIHEEMLTVLREGTQR